MVIWLHPLCSKSANEMVSTHLRRVSEYKVYCDCNLSFLSHVLLFLEQLWEHALFLNGWLNGTQAADTVIAVCSAALHPLEESSINSPGQK